MAWDTGLIPGEPAYRLAAEQAPFIRAVAGPGTGKTFGLERRITRLLSKGVSPDTILAVTFTRTAAQDLKKSISGTAAVGADKVIAKTLHSLCFGILKKRGLLSRRGKNPRPLLDYEQVPMLYDLNVLMRDKEERLRAYEAAWARVQSQQPGAASAAADKAFQAEVIHWLESHHAMLFGEMITMTLHYLEDNENCPERRQYTHVLADEYQDLNKADQKLIDLLASNASLVVIGDDDQSIYGFRFAHPQGIRQFPETHAPCTDIKFDICRRCPQKVALAASRLISRNKNRTLGDLLPHGALLQGDLKTDIYGSEPEEAQGIAAGIASEINRTRKKADPHRIKPKDVLVLAPSSDIGRMIEKELLDAGIPAKAMFKSGVLKSDRVKYSFSMLTLLARCDDGAALRYLLGQGGKKFRAKSYRKILDYARDNRISVFDTLNKCARQEINIAHYVLRDKYIDITCELEKIECAVKTDPRQLVDMLIDNSPDYKDFRDLLNEAVEKTRFKEGCNTQKWFDKVRSYVYDQIFTPENTPQGDFVRIMSLHASKGLSAKYVVVAHATRDALKKHGKLEEQRRLFYVAITRCKGSKNAYPGKLVISTIHKQESIFIRELGLTD